MMPRRLSTHELGIPAGAIDVPNRHPRAGGGDDVLWWLVPVGAGSLFERAAGGVEAAQRLLEILGGMLGGNETAYTRQHVLPLLHQQRV